MIQWRKKLQEKDFEINNLRNRLYLSEHMISNLLKINERLKKKVIKNEST